MKRTIEMPRVSMNMEEATVVLWHKGEGELFQSGEPLYEIETEKVTTEVEAPLSGRLIKILIQVGQNAEVGAPVCEIECLE